MASAHSEDHDAAVESALAFPGIGGMGSFRLTIDGGGMLPSFTAGGASGVFMPGVGTWGSALGLGSASGAVGAGIGTPGLSRFPLPPGMPGRLDLGLPGFSGAADAGVTGTGKRPWLGMGADGTEGRLRVGMEAGGTAGRSGTGILAGGTTAGVSGAGTKAPSI